MRRRRFALCVLALQLPLLAATPAPQRVRFTYRPVAAGELIRQQLSFQLKLKTAVKQDGKQVESAEQAAERSEKRRIELIEVKDKFAKARVTFESVDQRASQDGRAAPSPASPVTGKSYLVTRDGERLFVNDLAGRKPPVEELEVVERSMGAFGKPSLLARYFDGKTLVVGEKVKLPAELAREVLGPSDALGEVMRFEMRLVGTRQVDAVRCAEFETSVEAKSRELGNLTMLLSGTSLLEVDTCRAASASLAGPIGMFESRSRQGQKLTVEGRGTLELGIRAQRQAARR
jgi:hypothetical protein